MENPYETIKKCGYHKFCISNKDFLIDWNEKQKRKTFSMVGDNAYNKKLSEAIANVKLMKQNEKGEYIYGS